MKTLVIIPARFASTRFPGKPLAKLGDKTMIQWVYENVKLSGFDAVVATDDMRIADEVTRFGGLAIMTAENHTSGTDRCLEAAEKYGAKFGMPDILINVQGDEPFIKPTQIIALAECFSDNTVDIATMLKPFDIAQPMAIFDTNKVKAIINSKNEAIYFSRTAIPFQRDVDPQKWIENTTYYLHLGMYGYRFKVLKEVCSIAESTLEKCEKLEQLRWIEHGYKIKTAITNHQSIGIDTPDDLEKAHAILTQL